LREVVLKDGSGYRADADGEKELVAARLSGAAADRGRRRGARKSFFEDIRAMKKGLVLRTVERLRLDPVTASRRAAGHISLASEMLACS
jgi:hypothetical protein